MRNLDPDLAAALASGYLRPAALAMLTFKSSTQYVWSGRGTLQYDGQSYVGVGSLGKIGDIKEGVDVQADGTSVTLSGIDPQYLGDCLNDIQIGAPAKIWIAALTVDCAVIGAPYLMFAGTVDRPAISVEGKQIGITLALESKLVNHSRASNRRYTTADQRAKYPDDTAFDRVEQENDKALRWGS